MTGRLHPRDVYLESVFFSSSLPPPFILFLSSILVFSRGWFSRSGWSPSRGHRRGKRKRSKGSLSELFLAGSTSSRARLPPAVSSRMKSRYILRGRSWSTRRLNQMSSRKVLGSHPLLTIPPPLNPPCIRGNYPTSERVQLFRIITSLSERTSPPAYRHSDEWSSTLFC